MSEDDQHFVEDDNSEDDKFEENLEKQYALYPKKIDKRPESKHGRPESSKFSITRPPQLGKEQIIKPIQDSLQTSNALKKFNQLVSFHKIQIEQFWLNHTISASKEEFIQFLLQAGFQFNQNEIIQIISDLSNDRGIITIELLCKKVPSWNQNENAMLEFIREKALKLAQESKRKFSAQRKPQSASTKRSGFKIDSRPMSGISKKYQSGFTDLKISNINERSEKKKYNPNECLREARLKQLEEDRLLQLTINQGKNEYEYEMLIKMGEANELSEQLDSKITYRAIKTAQGYIKVHVYDMERFIKDMTLEDFQREYNILRSKYNEKRNLKIWEVLNEKKKNQKSLQHFGSSQKEEAKQIEGDIKLSTKKERQQELKKVLLETMMLSNVLKEQIIVLNKKGINATHNQSIKL